MSACRGTGIRTFLTVRPLKMLSAVLDSELDSHVSVWTIVVAPTGIRPSGRCVRQTPSGPASTSCPSMVHLAQSPVRQRSDSRRTHGSRSVREWLERVTSVKTQLYRAGSATWDRMADNDKLQRDAGSEDRL